MIRQIRPEEWSPREDSEAALRLAAAVEIYGDAPFWRLYAGDGGSVLSVMDGTAVLLPGEDAAEAGLFLRMSAEVVRVRTDAKTARLLAAWGFSQVKTGAMLRREPSGALLDSAAENASPREVYALLQAVFAGALPPWDVWYADVFYRRQRGRCRMVGIYRDGVLVSAAMTVAETAHGLLCGGVATREDWRGQGLARACVAALGREAQKEGKPLWLAPETAALRRVYEPLGFVPGGTWGEASRA